MNFNNKRITIMGLGLLGGGVGTAEFLAQHGANVLVTDLKSEKELAPSLEVLKQFNIQYILGHHREKDFIETDMVLKSPAVPQESDYLSIARDHGVDVEMAESLFMKLSPTKQIIGVTGTRGKSTTTAMIYHILKESGIDVYLAGNQKDTSTLKLLDSISADSTVVLELSSWQLESFGWHELSPHIALITNIYPDHLNRYSSMEEYIHAKSNIFLFQNSDDYAIFNNLNEQTMLLSKKAFSHISYFSSNDLQVTTVLPIPGSHNLENAAAAASVCRLCNITNEKIVASLSTFTGLPGRLETIGTREGVMFVNDTTSTTPTAGIKALESFPEKKIVLIVGGNSKNLPLEDLVDMIKKRAKAVVYLKGSGTDILKKELDASGIVSAGPYESLSDTVSEARKHADAGDIILFSPSFTSFGQFTNEFDRGEAFNHESRTKISSA